MKEYYKIIIRRRGERHGYKLICSCMNPDAYAVFKIEKITTLSRGEIKQERNRKYGVKFISKGRAPYFGVHETGRTFCASTKSFEYIGNY